MSPHDPHAAATIGTAVAALVSGVLLLLQALGLVTLSWSLVLPLVLVVVGVTTATAGLVGAARHRS